MAGKVFELDRDSDELPGSRLDAPERAFAAGCRPALSCVKVLLPLHILTRNPAVEADSTVRQSGLWEYTTAEASGGRPNPNRFVPWIPPAFTTNKGRLQTWSRIDWFAGLSLQPLLWCRSPACRRWRPVPPGLSAKGITCTKLSGSANTSTRRRQDQGHRLQREHRCQWQEQGDDHRHDRHHQVGEREVDQLTKSATAGSGCTQPNALTEVESGNVTADNTKSTTVGAAVARQSVSSRVQRTPLSTRSAFCRARSSSSPPDQKAFTFSTHRRGARQVRRAPLGVVRVPVGSRREWQWERRSLQPHIAQSPLESPRPPGVSGCVPEGLKSLATHLVTQRNGSQGSMGCADVVNASGKSNDTANEHRRRS